MVEDPPEASALLSPRENSCAANVCDRCSGQSSDQCTKAVRLLWVQVVAFAGGAAAYVVCSHAPHYYRIWREMQALKVRSQEYQERNRWLRRDIDEQLQAYENKTGHPFTKITGGAAHTHPIMYGKVKEKTIWSYYYHPELCNSSRQCTLPPYLQLCSESVRKNKGDFDYRLLHADEAESFVSLIEIPVRWRELDPTPQRDALMNALLARYGGVALDVSTVLLRPLDDLWAEMVTKGATFRGYMYRINGHTWPHAEVSVMWFLMARREGVFSTAVRSQVIGMGDRDNTKAYRQFVSALGDLTLVPILSMYNYSLPKCIEDPTVSHHWQCPENEQKPWYLGITGPAKNDTIIMMRDPRDGPQLPFQDLGMGLWKVFNSTPFFPALAPGARKRDRSLGCTSMKECWEGVFLPRFLSTAKTAGEARLLDFVHLADEDGALAATTRQELMSDPCTYFSNWMRLAHVPGFAHGCNQREETQLAV